MKKQKGYYKNLIPVYIYQDKDCDFLEGTNWFWERILTFVLNLELSIGTLEEVDYDEYLRNNDNKIKIEDFR